MRTPAEAGRHVQRRAAVAAVRHADGFAGVDADPDFERKARIRVRLLGEPRLEIDGSPDRLAGGREHGEPLVASNLDQDAAMSLDTVGDELDELGGEPRSRFVPVLLGEAGVAAHIGDEERAYACLFVVHDPVSMPRVCPMRDEKRALSARLAPDPVALGRYAAGRCLFV